MLGAERRVHRRSPCFWNRTSRAGVPIPKFANTCGTFPCELRNQGTLAAYGFLVPLRTRSSQPDSRHWTCELRVRGHERPPCPVLASSIENRTRPRQRCGKRPTGEDGQDRTRQKEGKDAERRRDGRGRSKKVDRVGHPGKQRKDGGFSRR